MLYLLISVAGIFITIFFVVGTHEFAHFFVARLLGIKVLRFSIGFGKKIFAWRDKKNTEYVVALIPLGGYVQMLDEREGKVAKEELPYAFNTQPYYKKTLVVLAGPIMNLFCAMLLYWAIFMIGFVTIKPVIGQVKPQSIAAQAGLASQEEIVMIDQHLTLNWTSVLMRLLVHLGNNDEAIMMTKKTDAKNTTTHQLVLKDWQLNELTPDLLSSLGIVPYQPPMPLTIGLIADYSPAKTHLKINDQLLAINNVPIKSWEQLIKTVANHPNETVILKILRQGKTLDEKILLGSKRNLTLQKTGYLGVSPNVIWPKNLQRDIQYSPLVAFAKAGEETINLCYFNLLLFGKLITGKISLQSLSGPITIFESAGDALNYGLIAFLSFLAFLSIAIGIINLLPIPGLDGGHVLIQTIELFLGRPLSLRVLFLIYRLGFLVLFLLLFQAILNDILRLF